MSRKDDQFAAAQCSRSREVMEPRHKATPNTDRCERAGDLQWICLVLAMIVNMICVSILAIAVVVERLSRKGVQNPADLGLFGRTEIVEVGLSGLQKIQRKTLQLSCCERLTMISCWSEWKRYPRASRGEHLEAPIGPGIYEARYASTGALFGFGAVDNLAQALALLTVAPRSLTSWFGRREITDLPDLEYRTCATSSKADAKIAAERMIGRRETYISGAA